MDPTKEVDAMALTHADHTPEYVHDLNELVSMFPEHERRAVIGDNARALFQLP